MVLRVTDLTNLKAQTRWTPTTESVLPVAFDLMNLNAQTPWTPLLGQDLVMPVAFDLTNLKAQPETP